MADMLATTMANQVMIAREAMVLRPRRPDRDGGTDLWPVFGLIVDDQDLTRTGQGRDLLAHLDGQSAVTLLDGACVLSVLSEDGPVLGVTLSAATPVALSIGVVLPARSLRAELGMLAEGPTIGITTLSRARRLRGGVDTQTALGLLVLARSEPLPCLAALAEAS